MTIAKYSRREIGRCHEGREEILQVTNNSKTKQQKQQNKKEGFRDPRMLY